MPRRGSPAADFRRQIEAAEAEGVSRGSMTLRLTLSDVSHLKRDRALAVSDISFSDGEMRFLDVKVEQGGVAESTLDRGGS
ncbi:hypothetical protein [Phenylobacterium zucineum]|uniref:hypothetical protein n=1 Tax=Phenylobacterium zucineum TaxID=284016 RepID=UPI0002FF4DC1|nr:hypothetical protein [Phenylobacterium zucineum]